MNSKDYILWPSNYDISGVKSYSLSFKQLGMFERSIFNLVMPNVASI